MDMKKIGLFLSRLRKEQGMTQEQLGQKLGTTNKTISRWETGTYLPPADMLLRLSELYGITINEILSGQRLAGEQYREQAEENLRSVLTESPFSLEDRITYYRAKWRKDHFWSGVFCRVLIWSLLAVGIFTKELPWVLAYAVGNVVYYIWERNRMMIYVEDRAFDGSGRQ